ncbi:serine/threonine protein kinase [Streptomyces endophyticus]|uniref:non-specific serine/threonine protein kinase n=1 Tax=Streptomyces endophyticus TaxID=714166 RepID=A0ABU6F6G5_9ACTN|nr:serine/threonine-protein kinase [Streptomyces endophyticus]MEB8339424.1 serine/threonine protein kinase [Streptomyces endophyticus]
MNAAALSPEDPTELGGFELLGRIGHGGMGQVYLGESPGGEPAAVKVIKPSVVDSETRLRFAQEIEVLKTIWGPRIAAFLDADADAEQPWLATEYVDGPDLRKHVHTHGPLPLVLTASLGATLAEALHVVHKQGLLHRDLKPANILLGQNGPKVIDFGLAVFTESSASLTAPNTVLGTPACMAPEQAMGEKPLSPGVDVYALGAVLLFAASGHYPFRADNIHALFNLIVRDDSRPDFGGAPDELVPLLTAMLSHKAGDRPTLPEVVKQCRAVVEGQGMKIAQARRRLTAHITDTRIQDAPTEPPPPTLADRTTVTTPQPTAPTVLLPEADTPPAAYTPTVKVRPGPSAPTAPPARPTAPPGAPPVSSRSKERSAPGRAKPVLHSAQAKRVAQQLRETYAQHAKF